MTRWNWRRCLGHIIVVPPKVLLVGRQSSGPRPRLGLGERGLDCWFSFRLVKRGYHQEIAATAIVGVPSFASPTRIAAEAMSAVVIVSTGERAECPIARPYGAGRRCHRSNRSAGHCRDDRVEMTTPSSVTGMERLNEKGKKTCCRRSCCRRAVDASRRYAILPFFGLSTRSGASHSGFRREHARPAVQNAHSQNKEQRTAEVTNEA